MRQNQEKERAYQRLVLQYQLKERRDAELLEGLQHKIAQLAREAALRERPCHSSAHHQGLRHPQLLPISEQLKHVWATYVWQHPSCSPEAVPTRSIGCRSDRVTSAASSLPPAITHLRTTHGRIIPDRGSDTEGNDTCPKPSGYAIIAFQQAVYSVVTPHLPSWQLDLGANCAH